MSMETEMDENKDSGSSESLYSSDDDSSIQCLPKYTLREARTINNNIVTDEELTCTNQIPKYILNKLMIGDYHAREFKVKPLKSSKTKTKDAYDSDDSDDEEERVNPMDALLLLFHLSDECLRQHLALKLDECQLSVPFLLPHPEAPTEKVTILLRALENITKFCRSDASNDKKRTQQVFATEHPFPVVSFIRIGDITMSKSSLINKIMSDGNEHHEFFFHNDVTNPDVYRKIVDGCVELSWYLPGEREKQTLETDICFANLRGDARVFKKQFRLILKISSVLCILLPSNYQDQTITEILKQATYSPASIILLFNEIRCLDSVEKYFDDMKINHRGKMSLLMSTKKFDEDYFIQKMRINIQKKIHEVKPMPLTKLESCAKKFGFHLDGNESHFTLRKTVDSWLGMGIKEAKIRLKLQMHVPALADLEREKCFSNHDGRTDRIGGDIDKIYKAIEEVKTAQKQSFAHLDERIVHFLNSIAEMNTTERNCTLNKMKHELNKMSLQVMPELHQEYRLALLKNRDKQAQVWKHLQQLEESIITHSFGLEHIIRELAQLYEIEECKYDYAGVAADMLLSGQPLEILDGDSFYIPLEWFNGVYRKLESKTKNAKIFVISVLGIQSSGKSTMLNTMFGLDFPVSAGRCTRGVFASLLPVSDSTKCNSSLEYVLILDSEGFRGSRNHEEYENELGMFVIGAADLTIVNIFGISRDEITQFLDKTVHAFLRMKLLTEKKSCKIVHQNFEAAEEREKIDDVRRNLNQDLDRMTKLAATQENCVEQFQHFNEVVSFDENEDVFYIPSLYQENSQMAPRRPEYGRAVQRIKENVVTLMCSKEMYKYSISQFRERICKLWEVILRGRVDEISTDEFKKTRRQKIAETKFIHDLIVKPVSKFTLQKARTVDNHIIRPEELMSDKITDYIFKMLMIADYRVREFELKQLPSNLYESEDSSECSDDSDNWDDESVNPMDAMLGIFHESDDTLRRYIVNKLSACQLSVPFLLPHPDAPSENVKILLSALESITKCWKDGTDTKQVFATEHPFPVVSFIRIGKPTMSKSLLINGIMSDGGNYHNFFFHKEMNGGHVERKVVDGLVEVSWFLPSGRETQILKNEICFANLRGDARYFKKQFDLLSAISSIIFIILPSEYGEKTGKTLTIPMKFLEEAIVSITNFNGKVILIFNEKIRQTNAFKYFNDLKSRKTKLSLITSAKRDLCHWFLQRIREKIQVNVNKKEASPLVKLASRRNQNLDGTLAQEVSNLDETRAKQDHTDPDVTRGKDDIRSGINAHQMSDDDSHQLRLEFEMKFGSWLKLIKENGKDLLNLQKHIPVLAELIRERYCPKFLSSKSESYNVHEDVDKIDENIKREKIAQKETLKNMDERTLTSLNCIATMNEIERNYTVNSLKHCLDKMSLQITTKLRENYKKAKKELRKKEEMSPKSNKESPEQKHLKELEDTISKYSFGLEHIIRELAQLYQIEEIKYDYAGAAADMLLSGQPLEILDGDSFYIPLEWLKAVFTKLDEKKNKAKTFVISIMGIQSSGKSTMLNTMFGLEIPVRAVRCKRGAFANLLPVSDSLKSNSGFEYVLIIDTEGLKGSADPEIRIHDNQMATFAIGVADVTIVNIVGEYHAQIKGFLEIAVHAFLKMNLVEERKRSCKIVHQNVYAYDAVEKLSSKRSELKKDLDKMTELAAMVENCGPKYKKIDDIISFDEHKDVFYIPSLLKGNPPMAPVNPEYGRAVQRVKETIVNLMYSEKCLKISFSQFQDRVCKLWESMLRENFIFSFRNVMEVRAFRSLDRKYFNESVKLMVIKMGELQTKIEVALKRCSTQEELVKEWERMEVEIPQEAEKLGNEMKEAMDQFFITDQDKAILEKWRENIMNRITEQKEIQVRQVRRNCESNFNFLQSLQNVEKIKQTYEKELLEKAREFITSNAAVTDDKKKLNAKFEKEWKQCIAGVLKHKETKRDVNNEMVNVLCKTNPFLNAKMRKKLEKQNYNILRINDSDTSTSILESALGYFLGKKRKPWHPEDRRIKDIAKSKALQFAKKTLRLGARCTRNNLTQMYHIVITTIDEETNKSDFESSKSQESLKCDILLHVFSESYEIFNEMEERFIQEQDIRVELERNVRPPKLEKYFENVCKLVKTEMAATSFIKALQIPIESTLNSTMGRVVAKQMLHENKYQSKGRFHALVLIQLGEESKFESYIPYLQDPIKFLRMKLKESPENYCLEHGNTWLFEKEIKRLESEVFDAISTANEGTRAGNKKMFFWIKRFQEECKTLIIGKKETSVLAAIEDLEDIEVFQEEVVKKIKEFFETLINRGLDQATIRKWNPSLGDFLCDFLIGCQSVCPFCGALCNFTVRDHPGRHSTRIHRPLGINGSRHDISQKLKVTMCTNAVASNMKFRSRNAVIWWKPHPYEDDQLVNDYYESWSIPADLSFESSKYFQWFMATFSKELANLHGAKEPDIPRAWQRITFSEARAELQEIYNL